MRNIFFIFLFLAAVLPSVYAFDCSQLSRREMCTEIQSSSISQAEKDYLLSDIISDKKQYPDYAFVKSWNERVPRERKLFGATTYGSGYISGWMKILSILPAVQVGDTLYVDTAGQVLSGAGYSVSLPYYTEAGDCKTERSIAEQRAQLSVYANNLNQGQGNNVRYSTRLAHNTPITFRALYEVYLKSKIEHHKDKEICFRDYCITICSYSSTEYKEDRLRISDMVNAKVHNPDLTASFKIVDKLPHAIKGELIFNPELANIELSFADASVNLHNYEFSEQFSKKPLDVLMIYGINFSSQEVENLAYENGKVTVADTDGCQIKVYSFFKEKTLSCDLSFEEVDFTVDTDKIIYDENEQIEVSIEPTGKEYVISYGDEEQITTGTATFTAQPSANRITVRYKDRIVEHLIHVKNEKPLAAGFSLAIFGTLNYALVGFIKKYWGGLIG